MGYGNSIIRKTIKLMLILLDKTEKEYESVVEENGKEIEIDKFEVRLIISM